MSSVSEASPIIMSAFFISIDNSYIRGDCESSGSELSLGWGGEYSGQLLPILIRQIECVNFELASNVWVLGDKDGADFRIALAISLNGISRHDKKRRC